MQNLFLIPAPLLRAFEAGTPLGGSTGPDLSRYFFVSALLILMTLGVAWGLRKLVAGNLKLRASQRSLRVIDVLGMGNRRKIAVVRCYDRTFVLGLGEKEICAIAELDAVIGSEEQEVLPRKSDRGAFAEALEQVRRVMPAKPAAGLDVGVGAMDSVAPALSRKLAQREPQTTQVTVSPTEPKAPRRRVRRKVERRAQLDPAARQREARSVASAAMEIAAEKRKAQAAPSPPSPQKVTEPKPQEQPAEPKPRSLPRLEGILG